MDLMSYDDWGIRADMEARRAGWQRWYASHAVCPYGCDGSGFVEIALREYWPDEAIPDVEETVWPHGLIMTPCQCQYRNRRRMQ